MAFKYGNTTFPLSHGGATLLAVCDPGLAKILDYLAFMIRQYADFTITAVFDLPSTDGSSPTLQSAIAQVVPIDPDTIAKAEQFQFPLLAGWRKSAQYNSKTLNWDQDISKVGLAYILPPLTASQSVRFVPALTSISKICNYALKAGHDPAYNSDERIIADNFITSARLMTAHFGAYDFGGNAKPPYFPAWVAELEMAEQQTPYTAGLTDMTGADVTVTQQKDDAETPITIIEAMTEVG